MLDLSMRKAFIENLLYQLDSESSSNRSLFEKLKGTPILLSSSLFHLIHMTS